MALLFGNVIEVKQILKFKVLNEKFVLKQKADYLTDDTYNDPYIYPDIETTHVIDEVYQFSLAMRKQIKSNGFLKFFNHLELSVKFNVEKQYLKQYFFHSKI